MLTSLVFAWALVVQVQLQICQEGVCTPHPKLQERARVVHTLESESACLLLQMDMQRAYAQTQQAGTRPAPPRKHLVAKATFLCQPNN